jgi:LmbE family N-acetylglucosaminyl deacetylase
MNGNVTMAEMRVAELHCAARVLGLSAVHLLDYRDSGMANTPDNTHPQALAAQPVNKVADEISHYIRLLKPQVVMTFDPIGGYHHPDHIAIHRATVAAFHATTGELGAAQKGGRPVWRPAKLYFHLMPHGFLRMAVKLLPLLGKDPRKFGSNKDIDLTVIAESRFPIHAKIDTHDYVHLQAEASACHASQGGREMSSGFQAWLSRIFRREDLYMRDYPVPYPGEPIEKDLFQGL